MVFVVLSGLPLDVDPADLAQKINTYFGENKEIGTFRVNIDDSDIRKPKAVLKFKQGFDAMEAQRLLDNFKYIDPVDSMIYNIKALVPTNDQPYQSLFREEISDIAEIIVAEKQKRKKEKKAKKRKRSPIDESLLADQSAVLKKSLEITDIEKLEKLHKKLRKKEKAERRSQSDRSASESEYRNKERDKSIYGESSGVSKRPRSPEDHVLKKKYIKELSLERKGESSKALTSITHHRSRSTTTSDSISPKSWDSPKEERKITYIYDDTASSKSYDSRKVNIDRQEHRRPSERWSSDDRKPRYRSEHHDPQRQRSEHRSSSRPVEDLRHKVEARRSSVRAKERDYERYYNYGSTHESPRKRMTSHSEGGGWSDTNKRSSNESTDSEYTTVFELQKGKRLLLLAPHYLTEKDKEFQEALVHIIHTCTVATDTERLQPEDKKLIIDNYKATVVSRLKHLKFTNLMSVQDIVLDYKLVYKTADDKILINNMIKELQALGKGTLLPEIKRERLHQAIDEVFDSTDIDELIEDVKPEIKTEKTMEVEYENEETTEVINIVVNLVPIEKRELPFETDPEKVAEIKVFVSELKKTKPTKFFRPIRSLLNEMKLFIYNNAKVVPSEVILNRMVEVLEKILARMMGPIKTRVKSKDVCNLFRNAFPYTEDREFVDMIIKWIVDGEFDKGAVDGLIMQKIPKIEKNKIPDENNSKNEPVLPAPFKAEPEDAETEPTIPLPIKEEIKTDKEVNQSEQSATSNVEQQTKDVQPSCGSKTTNNINLETTEKIFEIIDEDIIIKKETVEVITIEDDDLVDKEPGDDNIPVPTEIKSETILDSDDEGALSDDSRTTQVIDTKPFIESDPAFEITTQNVEQGASGEHVPGKSEILYSEPGEIVGEEGEILDDSDGEPGENPVDMGETIDDIRLYLKSEK